MRMQYNNICICDLFWRNCNIPPRAHVCSFTKNRLTSISFHLLITVLIIVRSHIFFLFLYLNTVSCFRAIMIPILPSFFCLRIQWACVEMFNHELFLKLFKYFCFCVDDYGRTVCQCFRNHTRCHVIGRYRKYCDLFYPYHHFFSTRTRINMIAKIGMLGIMSLAQLTASLFSWYT